MADRMGVIDISFLASLSFQAFDTFSKFSLGCIVSVDFIEHPFPSALCLVECRLIIDCPVRFILLDERLDARVWSIIIFVPKIKPDSVVLYCAYVVSVLIPSLEESNDLGG